MAVQPSLPCPPLLAHIAHRRMYRNHVLKSPPAEMQRHCFSTSLVENPPQRDERRLCLTTCGVRLDTPATPEIGGDEDVVDRCLSTLSIDGRLRTTAVCSAESSFRNRLQRGWGVGGGGVVQPCKPKTDKPRHEFNHYSESETASTSPKLSALNPLP